MLKRPFFPLGLCGVLLALMLSACATTTSAPGDSAQPLADGKPATLTEEINLTSTAYSSRYGEPSLVEDVSAQYKEKALVVPGTGNFINRQAATKSSPVQQGDGVITLNFEAADIRDVVKVVFDTLQENYIIDPQVAGEVTVQTSRPLPREMLIPTLETLLSMNGAAVVYVDGVYKVVPLGNAAVGNTSPRLSGAQLRPGYSVRIFPLQYISALEMQKILEPFTSEGEILRVDPMRNMIIVGGTALELTNIQETVNIFDVNWLRGMTVAMYSLQNTESQTIATELDGLFGESSGVPLAGMFRFVPVERINALLVITSQAEYLKDLSEWIERLDGRVGEQLFVYPVQNGSAEYIAGVLSEVFGGTGGGTTGSTAGRVAPGREPVTLSSGAEEEPETERTSSNGLGQGGGLRSRSTRQTSTGGAGAFEAGLGSITDKVRIIPDTENNALLIWANSQNYEKILSALRKIDVTPRQVLIEATIAEVTLTGALQYGLQWFFQNNVGGYDAFGSLNLGPEVQVTNEGVASLNGAFSYSIVNSMGNIRVLLTALASDSKLKVLSSPQLMVTDNQEATIRVGDQVPVLTSSTFTGSDFSTQNIEFKDTGVLLEVRPQINEGGLVTMDINQEVTDVSRRTGALNQSVFFQRTINSRVAILSGQTIVLGGLIRDNQEDSRSGIPILYKLPIIGPLFSTTTNDTTRTELIVLITPRIIRDNTEALGVTQELKRRMKAVAPLTDIF